MDAVSICVPTPLRKTGDPDLSYILSAAESLGQFIHPDMVVVLESTTYPAQPVKFFYHLTKEPDLIPGKNFSWHFPQKGSTRVEKELDNPQYTKGDRRNYTGCGEVAGVWYEQALQSVVPLSSSEVAEMAKLLENTFRMINIGLVNEMAIMCNRLGVDVWEVIEASATKPFGFMKFTPGPGLGGHCIPIDPLYLSWRLRALNYTARFIELASEINTGMPRYVISLVQDALNDHQKALNGSRVLVLGAAYKADIDDVRESPALDVIGLLIQKGAHVEYHDPYIPSLKHDGWSLDSVQDLMQAVQQADCVVIITNHSVYDYALIMEKAALIVDTRNALGAMGRENPKVVRL